MKILLVEDDKRVASSIARGLREERYVVDVSSDGEDALYLAQTGEYDLVILDLLLPKRSGLEILQALRADRMTVPVLVLTAKAELEDKVRGFESGADDYLTKPFRFQELLARVRALMRRRGDMTPTILRVGDLEMDTLRHRVARSGAAIVLTAREYALLEYLMRHADRVVSRTTLEEAVWQHDYDTSSNVIEVHVAHLRRKIDDPFLAKLLRTVRGTGYVIGRQDQPDG
ncbi:MAG: response regulator transcription factor [Candidatus Omnitrophica bacterium]|nr:response regulator transcription factor [Candidatus Omnitrophota bacterium]